MAEPLNSFATDAPRGLLILDSCILIDSLRGYEPAIRWLTKMSSRYDVTLSISVVTVAELLSGARSEKSLAIVSRLLMQTRAIPVDYGIAERAGSYLRSWRRSHGLLMPDALIAATAAELGAALITRDAAHFPMAEVVVKIPY